MLNKIIKILLIILFFLLPLINSHLVDLFGIKWGFYVDGNYEFTKVIFFNILSGIILVLFLIKSFLLKNKIIIPKIALVIILILFLSLILSGFPYTSLLGNTSKGHNVIMYLNLIGLFIVFINGDKKFNKKLILTTIFSASIVGIIGIKEYYSPSFDYSNLSNRALSTFGHPNYLALFILILIPFLLNKIKNYYYLLIIILVFLLFLTKSAWGIFIFLLYIGFILYSKYKNKLNKKYLAIFAFISLVTLGIIIYKFGLLTKLNSFISRFYIWETTLNIIFSDFKIFLFGNGIATLDLVFDSFKSPELYIFENIGFTADRPHNLIINFFYHFGVLGFILLIYLIYNLFISYKNNHYYHSIILFLLFTIFNFGGISHYLIILLIISIIYNINHQKNINKNIFKNNIIKNTTIYLSIISTLLVSLFGIIFSYQYYQNEYINHNFSEYRDIYHPLVEKIVIENSYSYSTQQSVEKYFSLGNYSWKNDIGASIIYNDNNDESIDCYKKGLALLPNMWNKESKYYNNYLIKHLFVKERFYSNNFSNLEEILERVGEKIEK